MDLMPSSEEEQIIDTARALLSRELPVEYARWEAGPAAAADRAKLKSFADLGWMALGLAEADGGFGFGATEEALLFREVGRALVTPALLAAVIAARLAAKLGDAGTVAAIIGGEMRIGLAVPGHDGRHYLIDADGADRILVIGAGELSLVPSASVTSREMLRAVDETTSLEHALLDGGSHVSGAEAELLGVHLSLLIAAMLTGSAEAVRDLTVAYVSERTQFGQKIGTFQAVSHPCADMAVRCEAALSQVKVAAISVRDERPDAAFQVIAARIVALDAALANAAAAVQLHGGMGFTAEYPVHFHLKRAHVLDQVGGTMAHQLDALFVSEAASRSTRKAKT